MKREVWKPGFLVDVRGVEIDRMWLRHPADRDKPAHPACSSCSGVGSMSRSHGIAARGLTIDSAAEELQSSGKTLADLLFWIDCLGAAVLVVEKHAPTIRFANTTAATFFLREAGSFSQCPVADVIGNEAEQLLGQVWSSSAVGMVGEPFIIRSLVNGQERLLMVRVTKIVVEGEPLRLFTFTDAPPHGSVTLAGWQGNMMEILNWFPFGFEIADNDDQIQFANAHCRKLFGYEQHELESAEDWWRLAYPDPEYRKYARTKWETEIVAARQENREMTAFDLDVTTASGEMRTIQFRNRTIGDFNVNLFVDVTRERKYERELKLLAGTDPLTGAMNRRRFFEETSQLFETDASFPIAMLMLDIDHFKKINDGYGHGAGDLVLREITRRCTMVLRGMDKFARFGGEEFAVLLPETTSEAAAKVAESLRAAIRNHLFSLPLAELQVTTSIGVTTCSIGDTIDAAISRADKGLYEAKRLGRDRVAIVSA
jgi:diguanylate cyclase (GGDEF)-like protein